MRVEDKMQTFDFIFRSSETCPTAYEQGFIKMQKRLLIFTS